VMAGDIEAAVCLADIEISLLVASSGKNKK
jgi:hypothetical protein